MRVLFLDTKPNNPNRYISTAVFLALKENDLVTEAVFVEYGDALARARSENFDAFIAFDGEEADNFVVSNLAHLIPRAAIWFTEDPYETYRNVKVASDFDLVFSNDRASVSAYGAKGRYLPLGANPSMFRAVDPAQVSHDIFFAGTAWPNRLEFLSRLRTARPDLRLNLALVSNPSLDQHISQYQGKFAYGRGLAMRDFCNAASRARLTLTLPRAFSTDPDNPTAASDTPGPRFFEVALAGSTQLVDRSIAKAASEFVPSAAFFVYDNFEECLEIIDRAIAAPDAVARMAIEAQTATSERHLYAHRAAQIIDALSQLKPRPRPLARSRPKILVIAHNTVAQGWFGGSEIYADVLVKGLDADISIMAPVGDRHAIHSYRVWNSDELEIDGFDIAHPVTQGDLVHEEFEHQFQALLHRNAFDIIHVNHLIRYPVSLLAFAKSSGAKITFSLHDYYLICENFTLSGFERRYCDIPNRPPATCHVCLAHTPDLTTVRQEPRLRMMREMSRHIDRVYYGAEASWTIFATMFPHMVDRGSRLAPPVARPQPAPARKSTPKLRVAILGNFSRVKGADTLLEVFEEARSVDVGFDIFGRVDGEYLGALSQLEGLDVIQHGVFPPGKPPVAIYDCRVALIVSPWPETYCMTLSELQLMGIVPIVTDLGGHGERVQHEIDGLKVAVNDAGEIVDTLRRLVDQPEEIEKLAFGLSSRAYDGPSAFVARADALFASVLKNSSQLLASPTNRRVFKADEIGIFLRAPRFMPPVYNPAPVDMILSPLDELLDRGQLTSAAPVQVVWRARIRFARTLLARFRQTSRENGAAFAGRRAWAWARHWMRRRIGNG